MVGVRATSSSWDRNLTLPLFSCFLRIPCTGLTVNFSFSIAIRKTSEMDAKYLLYVGSAHFFFSASSLRQFLITVRVTCAGGILARSPIFLYFRSSSWVWVSSLFDAELARVSLIRSPNVITFAGSSLGLGAPDRKSTRLN